MKRSRGRFALGTICSSRTRINGRHKNKPDSATLGETLSQPEVWRDSLRELQENGSLQIILEETGSGTHWLFLGCGTSFYLAEAAAASWTPLTDRRARALPAPELLPFPELRRRSEVCFS